MSEEAKDRRNREREVREKKIEEQIKHLDRIQTFVFGAMIGVSIAIFREDEPTSDEATYKIIGGSVFVLVLLISMVFLIFVRNKKIKSY